MSLQASLTVCLLGLVNVGHMRNTDLLNQLSTSQPNYDALQRFVLPEPRILNGRLAGPKEIPWQVLVDVMKDGIRYPFFGASIISRKWLLTIAQGLTFSEPWVYTINAGFRNRTCPEFTKRVYSVFKVIPHPHFDPVTHSNDIGLIETIKCMDLNDFIQPISYLSIGENIRLAKEHNNCKISGWGQTGAGWEPSHFLLVGDVSLMSNEECNRYYPGQIRTNMICSGGNAAACQDDAGSPLVCKIGGQWTLVGMASWGEKCGRGYPSVFTRVSFFEDWIRCNVDSSCW